MITIIDPHCHFADTFMLNNFTGGKFFGLGINPETAAKELVREAENRKLESSPSYVAGILDFNDNRFGLVCHLVKRELRKRGIDYSIEEDRLFVIDPERKTVPTQYLLAGEEVATDSGHIILLGGKQKIPKRLVRLEDVAKAGRDQGAIIISDHPLAGTPREVMRLRPRVYSYEGVPGRMGLSGKDVRDLCERDLVDFIEVHNPHFMRYQEEQMKLAEDLKLANFEIKGIAGSDSHTPGGMYSAFNCSLERVGYSNVANFVENLKDMLSRSEIGTYSSGSQTFESWRHALSVIFALKGRDLGILEQVALK